MDFPVNPDGERVIRKIRITKGLETSPKRAAALASLFSYPRVQYDRLMGVNETRRARQYIVLEINEMRINCPGLGLATKLIFNANSEPPAYSLLPRLGHLAIHEKSEEKRAILRFGSDFDPATRLVAQEIRCWHSFLTNRLAEV